MNDSPDQALLILLSGPSGSGKTTLCRRLAQEFPGVAYSVSCTTRPARPDEVPGTSYHFLPEEEFRKRVEAGAFLECAEVHGHWYGTLRQTVYDALRDGRDVLMDIDVQGASQLRDNVRAAPEDDLLREALVDVFVAPPSMEALHGRICDRGTDPAGEIDRRMKAAKEEMTHWHDYAYLVVNDSLDESYGVLRAILTAEHHRVRAGKRADALINHAV